MVLENKDFSIRSSFNPYHRRCSKSLTTPISLPRCLKTACIAATPTQGFVAHFESGETGSRLTDRGFIPKDMEY